MKTSPPLWLTFVFLAIVAALLGGLQYDNFRTGTISLWKYSPKVLRHRGGLTDLNWHRKVVTYRRATEPFLYWLSVAVKGFAFLVCTILAALMLFLTIMNW